MAKATNFKMWTRVEDGSTLEVSATGSNNNFRIEVVVVPSTGAQTVWQQSDVVPGPATLKLVSPRNYGAGVLIELRGTAPAKVEFESRIIKTDGSVHGKPYRFSAGPSGAEHRATIVIVTK